jgi:hypothetical protein
MLAVVQAATAAAEWLTSSTGVATTLAASTGLEAYGAYQQGQAEAQAAAYQRRVAKNNAAIAGQNAEQELFRAQITQQRQDWDAQQQIADIVSDQSGTGLSSASGSKFLLIKSLSDIARVDAANIRNEGEVTATNLKQQKVGFQQEADFYGSAESNARRSAGIGILRSFLGGAQAYNQLRVQGLIT